MSRWFRFYAEAMRNPKVASLSDQDFRLWVELLAVAAENDGHIPPAESLKHVLKRRLDHLSRGLEGLIRALLIDALADGYEPHNWSKFQYKSDTSTDRVHKFREKRNVSETPPEQKQSREERNIEPTGSMVNSDKAEPPVLKLVSPDDDLRLKPEHVVETWNATAKTIGRPCVRDLTPTRRQALKARIAQYSIDDFIVVFGKVRDSPFLRGDTGWTGCSFDWIIKKANFQKIIEGNYDGQSTFARR